MADIIGKFIERHGEDVLEALLVDQTTRRNIIWADSEYSDHGYGFDCMDEIAIPQLTGKYAGLIRTRADKALESQSHRKRDDDEQGDEAGGDAGLEPEDDHAGTETVPDDVLLAWREREFGHGLLCFGHCPFSPCLSVLLVGFCRLTGSLRVRPV